MAQETPLAIIGGGTMAQAILRGALDAKAIEPGRVAVLEPEAPKRELFRGWGVRPLRDAEELGDWLEEVEREPGDAELLLAVKPQSLEEVGDQLRPDIGRMPRTIISILAGTPTTRVRDAFGGRSGVIRAMPNMAASLRRSTTALVLGPGVEEGDDALAVALFESIGRVVHVREELMDAFTAVVGSGPAYVFFLTEAMTRAAIELGFDSDTAHWIARWTVSGAGALLEATDQPAEVLRAAVTSRGGTTAAAMTVLNDDKVMDSFVRAIAAARDRGRELSAGE